MSELERMLTGLGRELDWPQTPDLAASVTGRLRETAAARPPRRRLAVAGLRRSLVLALVALLLLAGTVLAAVPGARDAVLDLLGLQGATVERRERLPAPPPQGAIELGERTTLAGARRRLAFDPLAPTDPGAPDATYVQADAPGGELSLAYEPRPGLPRARTTDLGLLVTEFRGDLSPEYIGKVVGPGSEVERLRVDGEQALWIEGAPHFFFYRGPNGEIVETELRLAQNVLLLERGALLIRLEGAFDRERAVAVARSLR